MLWSVLWRALLRARKRDVPSAVMIGQPLELCCRACGAYTSFVSAAPLVRADIVLMATYIGWALVDERWMCADCLRDALPREEQ